MFGPLFLLFFSFFFFFRAKVVQLGAIGKSIDFPSLRSLRLFAPRSTFSIGLRNTFLVRSKKARTRLPSSDRFLNTVPRVAERLSSFFIALFESVRFPLVKRRWLRKKERKRKQETIRTRFSLFPISSPTVSFSFVFRCTRKIKNKRSTAGSQRVQFRPESPKSLPRKHHFWWKTGKPVSFSSLGGIVAVIFTMSLKLLVSYVWSAVTDSWTDGLPVSFYIVVFEARNVGKLVKISSLIDRPARYSQRGHVYVRTYANKYFRYLSR